jgi:Sulfotransferase family
VKPVHFCALTFLIVLMHLYDQWWQLKTLCVVPSPTPALDSLHANHSFYENLTPLTSHRPEIQSSSLRIANPVQVNFGDSIYTQNDWDSSPVVIEEFQLIFFTSAKVGCTTWKQLFRRIMGIKNWSVEEYRTMLPWNPELNGLKYLYHYNRTKATEMMTSPNWTRAIFLRDPKERFLSAYIDKAVAHPDYLQSKCCAFTRRCVNKAKDSISAFLQIIYTCDDAHWRPQWRRMEEKYWPCINFVGRMENVQDDAKRLLKKVGAWERYGRTGWGTKGKDSIFQAEVGDVGRHHATDAKNKLKSYLTPQLETLVEHFYADDYNHSVMNFTKWKLFE